MKKKRIIANLDGEEYYVEIISVSEDQIEIKVNETVHRLEIKEVTSFSDDERGIPVKPVTTAPVSNINEQYSVNEGVIVAPMPGEIIEIGVELGEKVKVGQEMCVLEAMKMKNKIRTPFAGTVTVINVTLGQSVEYGSVLIQLD